MTSVNNFKPPSRHDAKFYKNSWCLGALAVLFFLSITTAHAQNNDMQGMPPGYSPMGAAPVGDTANLEIRLSQMESAIQTLTGKVEQLGYQNTELKMKIQALQTAGAAAPAAAAPATPPMPATSNNIDDPDMDTQSLLRKTSNLDNPQSLTHGDATLPDKNAVAANGASPNAGATPGTLGQLTTTPGGAAVATPDDPTSQYEKAFALLKAQQYLSAEKGFTAFLAKYPSSPLAGNAQYWLGQSFYARNDFPKAARAFAESYQLYPKGAKAPDSLLKLAMSLNGMGKKDDACLTLTQLKHQYTTGADVTLARAEEEAKKIGCGN